MTHAKPPRLLSAPRAILLAAIGCWALLGSAGCQPNGDIVKTTEPRVEFGKLRDGKEPKDERIPTRILGGIAARGKDESWFFKMMGPADAVAKHEAAFDKFLETIEFSDSKDKPVVWTLPEGWREGPKKGRYATLLAGPVDDPVELSVMPAGGNLLDNVNRWRGQVGLKPVTESKEPECKEVTTKKGDKLMRINLSGLADKGGPMPPFMKFK